MISRFFKRGKKEPAKKTAVKKTVKSTPAPKKQVPVKEEPIRKVATPKVHMKPSKKLLTAEGWKRLMMKRTGKTKK